jgi:predicted metalloprotease
MRWSDIGDSSNVEDRRGVGGPMMIGGGGIGVLILALAVWLCGGDPSQLLQTGSSGSEVGQPGAANNRPVSQDENRAFAGAIEKSLEDTWKQVLAQQAHVRYSDPKLVLYTGQVQSACGFTSAAVGPFYCPGDQKLYLDFSFFDQLRQEFKAPGDFAEAYVIAHEFGHHIQNLMGTMRSLQNGGNQTSVALELQADCYAGVWGFYAQKQGRLDAGDTQEALRAASAVGDDTIERRTQGYVVPDSFTHGSSQQRMQWFSRGMQSGDMRQCQTFK